MIMMMTFSLYAETALEVLGYLGERETWRMPGDGTSRLLKASIGHWFGLLSRFRDRINGRLKTGLLRPQGNGPTVMTTVAFFPSCRCVSNFLNKSSKSFKSTPIAASSVIRISSRTLNFLPRPATDRNLFL